MENLLSEIDGVTAKFVNEFGSLTADELNWKPSPKIWSVAQNIDHLIVINQSYFNAFEALKKGKYKRPFLGNFKFLSKMMGKMILKTSGPNRDKKIKTFSIWEPNEAIFPADSIENFINHQEQLKQEISEVKTLAENGTIMSSPANKSITYPVSIALQIIVAHEKRHYLQAKELVMNFQKKTTSVISI